MLRGLSTKEVRDRLKIIGFNELPSTKPKTVWKIALEVMKEPMFILLIISGLLYITLGDVTEGIVLLSSILIIIFITFYQYQKTERALDALKKLSSPRALVIRDGIEVRVPGRDIVPDDIIILNEGDRVVADARIISSVNLMIDESMLTGESIPVTKSTDVNLDMLVFGGTLVVQGSGYAKVTATGITTAFGKIGVSLHRIVQEKTRLQKEMSVLIRNLFFIGALLTISVVAAFYFTRGNFIQSLLNGLASAMAILPEEFPVVLTIFLALGAWRLSKTKVLTRNPSVIETLGSATVLCSDKTGTITQNKMDIAVLYDKEELYLKNRFAEKKDTLNYLITTAQRASPKDSIDPMEKAIDQTFKSFSLSANETHLLQKEYPLSKTLLAMTRVLKNTEDGTVSVSAKGAPEAIFSLCHVQEQEIAQHVAVVNQMASQGCRVIAVAHATIKNNILPETQTGFDFKFLGLIGFEDPIRPEVPNAIKECHEAGIKVIMITGDYPATAKSIAAQIGLRSEMIITGDELKNMSDEEMKEKIRQMTIFARVVPEQKLRIVQALQANHEIVAMTGDGVNDAPALKAADIGIAMGNKGTDVAREASSLVLLDDNFASIVAAIRSGRRIFDNLQKAMSYIIAIHIPIIGLTLLPAFFTTLPLLLMPLHIVFMELIIDPVCSIVFEHEQEEKEIMKRMPRNPETKFFGMKSILQSVLQGLLLLVMVLCIYFLSMDEGHSEGEVRAIAFSSLIIGNIFLILTNLSKTRSFLSVLAEKNYTIITILSTAFIMLLLVISVPYLQAVFNFDFPGYQHFIPSILGGICLILMLETIKYFLKKQTT